MYIEGDNGVEVCEFHRDNYNPSDAALIAAAPDLLEAARDASNQLRTIAALLNHIPKRYAAAIGPIIRYGDIDAAIAKAEGKQP